MKHNAFIDELKRLGVRVEDAKGHLKLYYNGRQTICRRHPTKEISNQYARLVKKQLGLIK